MRSPFPGMDPYIEACGLWGDFHNRLISAIQDVLDEAAPDRYLVRSGNDLTWSSSKRKARKAIPSSLMLA